MNKNQYIIENVGCDDETTAIFEMDDTEYEFLKEVFEELNKHSSYGCQPKIHITKVFPKVEVQSKTITIPKWLYKETTEEEKK